MRTSNPSFSDTPNKTGLIKSPFNPASLPPTGSAQTGAANLSFVTTVSPITAVVHNAKTNIQTVVTFTYYTCPCKINLSLLSLGGTGCGFEFTNGIAYSIGTQNVTYTNLLDTCNCIVQIYINGLPAPVCVQDGQTITVTIGIKPACSICTQSKICSSNFFMFKIVNNKPVLKINRKEIIKNIKKRKKFIT